MNALTAFVCRRQRQISEVSLGACFYGCCILCSCCFCAPVACFTLRSLHRSSSAVPLCTGFDKTWSSSTRHDLPHQILNVLCSWGPAHAPTLSNSSFLQAIGLLLVMMLLGPLLAWTGFSIVLLYALIRENPRRGGLSSGSAEDGSSLLGARP